VSQISLVTPIFVMGGDFCDEAADVGVIFNPILNYWGKILPDRDKKAVDDNIISLNFCLVVV
jgi:hypothetical protein